MSEGSDHDRIRGERARTRPTAMQRRNGSKPRGAGPSVAGALEGLVQGVVDLAESRIALARHELADMAGSLSRVGLVALSGVLALLFGYVLLHIGVVGLVGLLAGAVWATAVLLGLAVGNLLAGWILVAWALRSYQRQQNMRGGALGEKRD